MNVNQRIPLVILTGGIACGKTFISDYLKEKGVNVVDTDVIARELTSGEGKRSQVVLESILAALGKTVFKSNGELDRGALKQLIFSDPRAKDILESILHPQIYAETLEKTRCSSVPYNLVVIPLIDQESRYLPIASHVLVVEVYEELQRQRVIARDNITEDLADRIIKTQISRLERRKLANTIIINTHRDNVKRVLDDLHQKFCVL